MAGMVPNTADGWLEPIESSKDFWMCWRQILAAAEGWTAQAGTKRQCTDIRKSCRGWLATPPGVVQRMARHFPESAADSGRTLPQRRQGQDCWQVISSSPCLRRGARRTALTGTRHLNGQGAAG